MKGHTAATESPQERIANVLLPRFTEKQDAGIQVGFIFFCRGRGTRVFRLLVPR